MLLTPNYDTFLQIGFYLNGKFQGTAYEDLYEGTYYPAISLYKLAKVSVWGFYLNLINVSVQFL